MAARLEFEELLRMGFILSKNKNPEPETEDSATDVPKEVIEYCENGLKKLQEDKKCHSLLKKHLREAFKKKNQKFFDKCQNCSDPLPPLNFDKKPFSFLCLKNTF